MQDIDKIESAGTSDSKLVACFFIWLFIFNFQLIYSRHEKHFKLQHSSVLVRYVSNLLILLEKFILTICALY